MTKLLLAPLLRAPAWPGSQGAQLIGLQAMDAILCEIKTFMITSVCSLRLLQGSSAPRGSGFSTDFPFCVICLGIRELNNST